METNTQDHTDDHVQTVKTQSQSAPEATGGQISKAGKSTDRRGWRPVLIRQKSFDLLKDVMKGQDRSKRTLDLAGIADGFVGHMLCDPKLVQAGIVEGRTRKRAEILSAADEWAD